MKIVCVSHGGSLRAGAELGFLEVVKGLAVRGYAVHAVIPEQGELTRHLSNAGIPFTVFPITWWVSPRKSWSLRFKRLLGHLPSDCIHFNQLLRRIRPDLVLTNTLTIGASAIASRWRGIPHVWYVQEFGREDHGFHFDLGCRLTYFLMNKLSRRIVVHSTAVQKHLEKQIPSHKICLVRYAVEVPDQVLAAPRQEDVFRLILVGRLVPTKGQDQAIRAVSLLVSKGLPVHLVLLGAAPDPEYHALLQTLVQSLGLANHVDFAGFSNDPFPRVSFSDVALMCSRNEACGRVTAEAMKLGKPVIGANTAGTAELIQDGFSGLLYEPGDVEDLSRKIEMLYHNGDLRRELGRNAREWSNSTFTPARQAAGFVSVFEEILVPHGARPVLNEAVRGE